MSRKDISFTFNFNAGDQAVATSTPVVVKDTKTPTKTKNQHQEMGVFTDIMPRRAPTPAPARRHTPEELAKLKRQRVYVDRFAVNVSDNTHKDFFVRYETAWTSYRAHSNLLSGKRYRHLQDLGKDYKAWARGVKAAGYATDPRYADKLIKAIEDLELYKYDNK